MLKLLFQGGDLALKRELLGLKFRNLALKFAIFRFECGNLLCKFQLRWIRFQFILRGIPLPKPNVHGEERAACGASLSTVLLDAQSSAATCAAIPCCLRSSQNDAT